MLQSPVNIESASANPKYFLKLELVITNPFSRPHGTYPFVPGVGIIFAVVWADAAALNFIVNNLPCALKARHRRSRGEKLVKGGLSSQLSL